MSICVRLENLTKTFGATVAIDKLSLEITNGEIFGILGPNGAGKSTTLHTLAGLVRPTSGNITVFGKDLRRNYIDIMQRVGVLVENPAFYDHLTVEKNLLIASRLAARDVTIDRALDLVGLVHVADRRVGTLSRGTRQRLGLAQALLTEPELLILDEPTTALDAEQAQETIRVLRHLADTAKVTILLSSHVMHEVETICDRVAIINQGKIVSCESTDKLVSYDKSCIDVILDSPDAAAKRLAQESWVEDVELKRGVLVVRLKNPDPHQLAAFLVSAGYKITGLIPRRRTLQDYFLKALNR